MGDDSFFEFSSSYPLSKAFGAPCSGRIAEEDVVDVVIKFANGETTPEWLGYVHAEYHDDLGKLLYFELHEDEDWALEEIDQNRAQQLGNESIESSRTLAREMLAAAACSVTTLAERLGKVRKELGESGVRKRLIVTFDQEHRPKMSWTLTGRSRAHGWILFACLYIADKASGDNTNIGHCKWHKCGRFFRVTANGPGKPARLFCPNTNHSKLSHSADSTRRSKISRERKREKKQSRSNGPRRRLK
jgi:hypothetical protein